MSSGVPGFVCSRRRNIFTGNIKGDGLNILRTLTVCALLTLIPCSFSDSRAADRESCWNSKYDYIHEIPPIVFRCPHGVFAGSYPANLETIEVGFHDVSVFLGHVCLCGAGGFRISEMAVDIIKESEKALEREEFSIISSRDHTVSDVIAYILGCSRRGEFEKNQYFIADAIEAPKREYHYYIAYHPTRKAVHVTYRKHLLVGNERMDRLWKIEIAHDTDPASVTRADMELYQDAMEAMVREVLLGDRNGLFEVESMEYEEFLSMLRRLESD
jgi:hypothetical protein